MKKRKLGKVQRGVLDTLIEHGEWCNDFRCGWLWSTPSETKRLLDSLVRAGYVRIDHEEIERRQRSIGKSRRYIEERAVYRPIKDSAYPSAKTRRNGAAS